MRKSLREWSKNTPGLLLTISASSLKELMFCPRKYQLAVLEGWREADTSVDLEFGTLAHMVKEAYHKMLLAGHDWETAQREVIKLAFVFSGHRDAEDVWHPWRGSYVEMWRCCGVNKYKNEKGNMAKCPYSHKGVWHEAPGPSVCGECGGDTETAARWLPFDPVKNRYNLMRFAFAYTEEDADRNWQTIRLNDGTPAVELVFRTPLPIFTSMGEQFHSVGYFDNLASFNQDNYIPDLKTTKKTLNTKYWDGYSPNVQVDLYDLVGRIDFPDLNLQGVMIEGVQLLVGGVRLSRHQAHRTDDLREEFQADLAHWLRQLEEYATNAYWPMNRANCWLCPFRAVCAAVPDRRQELLEGNFACKDEETRKENVS